MPNNNSTAKRLRQDKKKHIRNKSVKSFLKTKIKKFRTLIDSGNKTEAKKLLVEITKILDKAKNKNIIHQNKVNRQKSHLMKLLT